MGDLPWKGDCFEFGVLDAYLLEIHYPNPSFPEVITWHFYFNSKAFLKCSKFPERPLFELL